MIEEILKHLSNEYGRKFCLLRDLERLRDFQSLHDIDCYLPKSYVPDLIRELEIKFSVRCYLQINKANFSTIIVMFESGYIKFDFDHRFSWRGLTYLDVETVENNIIQIGGINCLAPELSLVQRIAKDILGAGKLPTSKLELLTDLDQVVKNTNYLEQFNEVFQYISELSLDEIYGNPVSVRKALIKIIKKNNIKKPHRLFYNTIVDIYNKYFKPTGKLIVLVGPDGSGKSSMSHVMCKNLGSNWFSDAVTYYSRPNILPALGSLLRHRRSDGAQNEDEPDNPNRKVSRLPGFIKITYYTVDFFLFNFWLYGHKINNRLVVFDRYFYDYEIQYFYQNISSSYIRFLKRFIPKPDAIVVLAADPIEIVKRKPELDVKTIEYQYEKIFEMRDEHLVVVRTDMEITSSFADLLTGCVGAWQKK